MNHSAEFEVAADKFERAEPTGNDVTEQIRKRRRERGLPGLPEDVEFTLTVMSDGAVKIWTRKGMPGTDLVALLRGIADGFADGTVRRVVPPGEGDGS